MQSRWTESEIRAAVKGYSQMLRDQEKNRFSSKKEVLDQLVGGPLNGRTRGSVDYRMANISAVLEANGRPFLVGYVPARNVGPTNTALIERLLRDEGLLAQS